MQLIKACFLLSSVAYAQLTGTLIPSANYFVNQEIGSDSNAGTLASPFLTVTKCLNIITTGQMCAVYGGTAHQLSYPELATMGAAKEALVGYGNFKPIMEAGVTIGSGDWSNFSGSVYQFTANTASLSSIGFISVRENGAYLPQVASLGGLTAPGYFVSGNGSLSGTAHTVYVFATGGGNPATNTNLYQYNSLSFGVFSQFPNQIVSGIQCQNNYHNDGCMEVGLWSLLTDINAFNGTKHNLLVHAGTTVQNVTAKGQYYANQSAVMLVFNDNSPSGEPIVVNNLNCIMPSFAVGLDCLYGHTNTGGQYGSLMVTGGSSQNVQGGYTALAVAQANFSGMTVTGSQSAFTLYAPTIISNVSVPSSTGNAVNVSAAVPVSILNSVISGASANQATIYSFNVASALTMTGSTITNPNANGYCVWSGGPLTMSGNAFTCHNGNNYIATSPVLISDHNTSGSAWQVNINSGFRTRSQACSLFGVECNSTP